MALAHWGLSLALIAGMAVAARAQDSVPFYHRTPDHAGLFIVPGLRPDTVGATTRDTGFDGRVAGVVNAAPLFWHRPGAPNGWVIVATEANQIAALDARTGRPAWQLRLGPAASRAGQCGNIDPVGVTGTPAIDTATGTLYADAVVATPAGQRHELFAVALATGQVLPGWPVPIGSGLHALRQSFDDSVEEQRGALALVDGEVYVPFGGYFGDCGDYHGMVVGIRAADRRVVAQWRTTALKGGVWAPAGIVADGSGLYIGTGNTAEAAAWGGGEAIVHLQPSLAAVVSPADYFSPVAWRMMDDDDLDLAGTGPTLVYPQGGPPAVLALGKNGVAYLLRRDFLGGVGDAMQSLKVSNRPILSATARYTLGGDQMVVVNAQGPGCRTAYGVTALRITGPSPHLTAAWCTPIDGRGAPIVTTSNGSDDPVVWIAGAEGDEKLHALDARTGAPLYTSAALESTVPHFATLTVADGKLFVPAENHIYAFDLGKHQN